MTPTDESSEPIAQRFIELDDPDGTTKWRLDTSFLDSTFMCIWGEGCQGIHDEPHPELMDGCCSVGVVLADDEEAMNIVALAATLEPDQLQFAADRDAGGLLEQRAGRWATKVIDGACSMLNRPGFPGGAGCALHLGALAAGEEPRDWKPRTCNRVPMRVDEQPRTDLDSGVVVTLRAWRRDDWGPGGEKIAWWCTEEPESYRAETPLHERLEPELRDIMGPELLQAFRDRLG